jgi:phosphonoacetaldehyde hydrolase
MSRIQAVILDWAGTTVDFGSLAPVAALQRVFESSGVPITAAEAREQMGWLKKDQIRAICAGPRVSAEWQRRHGAPPGEDQVNRLFEDFLPRQSEILAEYSEPIPGVPETIAEWRAAGVRIGSTTGYTRALLDIVQRAAAPLGYAPDASVTPDEAGGGRPLPFMCYRNAILLGVYPLWHCVKIGDTPSDVTEGLNAGMWTIGVTASGNEVGLSRAAWDSLTGDEKARSEQRASRRLREAGAHYIAPSVTHCSAILDEIRARIAAGERP